MKHPNLGLKKYVFGAAQKAQQQQTVLGLLTSLSEAKFLPARRYRSTRFLSLAMSKEIAAKELITCWKAEARTAGVVANLD